MFAKNKDNVLANVLDKVQTVIENSKNNKLVREAIALKASCYLVMNKPSEVIDLLDDLIEYPISFELLLSSAYYAKGDHKRSESMLQKYVYDNITGGIQVLSQMMLQNVNEPKKLEKYYNKAIDLAELFDVKTCNPTILACIYLTAANGYSMQSNKEKTLNALEEAIKIIKFLNRTNIELKGNEFFDLIDGYFEELSLGAKPPRSKEVIMDSLKDSILKNPLFDSLKEDKRYIGLIQQLKSI